MSGLNKVVVTGNLTEDPELRQTSNGVPVCDMRIAINTQVNESTESTYIDVVAWEKQAVSCGENLKKGSWILIDGRLKMSEWRSNSGQKRSKMALIAHKIVFLNAQSNIASDAENTANRAQTSNTGGRGVNRGVKGRV